MVSQKRRPEALLKNWRAAGLPFRSQPSLVKEFPAGLSNQSFLIEADNMPWVLRLDSANAERLGVDRKRELQIHELVAKEGLAPQCLVANHEKGYFITRFAEEETAAIPVSSSEQLDCLHSVFTKLHRMNVDTSPFDYGAQLRSLNNGQTLSDALSESLRLIQSDGAVGLCHHDPNRANVIFTNDGPQLIDWEYAAQGYPIVDIAAIAHEWHFSIDAVAEKFVVEEKLLTAALIVYVEMSNLWEIAARRLNLLEA